MADGSKPFKPSQIRLVLAAERLFAEQGIDSVSLADIARAADHANNAAVHYHFGSREGLLAAISAYRIAQLDEVRGKMLADVLDTGDAPDLRSLIAILFRSQLALADDRGGHPYAHFMVQYLTRQRPAGVPHASDVEGETTKHLHRLMRMIEAGVPHLPPGRARRRLELMMLTFHAMLMRHDNARLSGASGFALDDEVRDVTEMALAGLTAPSGGAS